MYTSPLSAGALRAPILHAIGELSVYRLSFSASLDDINNLAIQVALRDRPWATTVKVAEAEAWLDALDNPVVPVPTDLLSFFAESDRVTVQYAAPMIEESLRSLEAEGAVTSPRSGQWSLTRASLAEAVSLCNHFSSRNVTATWVNGIIDAPYLKRLEVHMAARCRRSEQFNELLELIHRFFVALIQRDGLRKMLAEGRQPTPSDIKNWVYRSALSKFRDEGRDALTRGFKGCLTEKDLRLGAENGRPSESPHEDVVARSIPSDMLGVFLGEDGEGHNTPIASGSSAFPLLDVASSSNLEEEIIHRMSGARTLSLLEQLIRREKPGAADRFARLFQMSLDDKGRREIAAKEGVSRNRAASLTAELQHAIRRAMAASKLAHRILVYVQEEPFSTFADISADVSRDGDCIDVSILDALVNTGHLRETRGSYRISSMGAEALDSGEFLSTISP